MLNTKEFYIGLGQSAAEAMNGRDHGRYKFHNSHFRKAKALEKEGDKDAADSYYNEGYAAARNIPRVEHFR